MLEDVLEDPRDVEAGETGRLEVRHDVQLLSGIHFPGEQHSVLVFNSAAVCCNEVLLRADDDVNAVFVGRLQKRNELRPRVWPNQQNERVELKINKSR